MASSESDESEILELDVGGVVYKTTKHTLLSAGDAYFSALFSGNWSVKKDKNGRIFVDRDGVPFRFVLEYLRNNDQMIFPESMEMKFRVHRESVFYGLTELKDMIENELEEDKTMAFSSIVELDVGGIVYKTTEQTLLSVTNTYFSKLFRGNQMIEKDKKGRIFIDRDGKIFRYVLEYLRNKEKMVLPDNSEMKRRVRQEAEFYGLTQLKQNIERNIRNDEYEKMKKEEKAEANAEAKAQAHKYYK